ncbi:MAG TPA: glutathione S-transferase family protein [Xanthobacteraceae bacterium]|jgi:glutathione S-transferase|nr:glutathione S-transferase family protein [Xanthobacteraceae bacterium]
MLKVWGRKTSSNVQKVMWAIGDLKLAHERVDVGGSFGKNKEAPYLAMNPNGLVPTLEDGDAMIWESNSIVRYLAAKYGAGTLEPADLKTRALASQWMDWQLSVVGPAIFGAFWGLIRTPPEKRDQAAIAASQQKTTEAMKMFDANLAKRAYAAGDSFSMGDIPVGIMVYRFRQLVPDRPPLPNLERWYAQIEKRPGFRDHVAAVPLT